MQSKRSKTGNAAERDQDALIPTQADLTAKESVEYFTPSGELPDPETAGETDEESEESGDKD